MPGIWQDVRFSLRGFRRNPAFSLTAILVIAVGTGAAAAVFSVVDRLLFRSLPYPDADRLVSFGVTLPFMDGEFLMANDYFYLRDRSAEVFSSITSWTGMSDCDLTEENPQRLACAQVESSFLPTFGVVPLAGRNFNRDEDRRNAPKVVLVSYGLWMSRFGGRREAIGKIISLDGTPTRIVGVLPRDFELPTLAHADLVVPQALAIEQYRPGQQGRPLRIFARLRNGVTLKRAGEVAYAYVRQGLLENLSPARRAEAGVVIRSLRDYQIADVKLAAWVLFAATGAILLIVCANMANLLLARSVGRKREWAVRRALGASRGRLLSQNFTESSLLSLAGLAPGCGLAWALLKIFQALAPTSIPRLERATLDVRVLLFLLLTTFVSGLAFGLAPALATSRLEVLSGWRAVGGTRHGLRHLLTTAQVAVSLVLLAAAGLLVESLWNLQNVNSGIGAAHVVTADITVGSARHPNAQSRQQFFETLTERLRHMPGVEAVAISDSVPPNGFVHSKPLGAVQQVGREAAARDPGGIVAWRRVSPEYFSALGIPMLEGRTFREAERNSADNVVILSGSLAHRVFPEGGAVGRRVHLFRDPADFPGSLVVGVCGDAPNRGLAEKPDPEYYILRKNVADPNAGRDASLVTRSLHYYDGEAFVIVRSRARPEVVAKWIRAEVGALDRTVPVNIRTMQQRLNSVSERPRFSALLLCFFALTGVLLAASGLYGLVSFLVAQKTQEVGVRMAVGATPAQIGRWILGHALRWSLGGVAVGLIGTAAAVRALGSLLFQVKAENPLLFAMAALLMILVTIAAAWMPSRRAAKIDPMVALRHE
ncbi:MAG TPA: ABC transporter permease [Bryobacteraceae bacterium]